MTTVLDHAITVLAARGYMVAKLHRPTDARWFRVAPPGEVSYLATPDEVIYLSDPAWRAVDQIMRWLKP